MISGDACERYDRHVQLGLNRHRSRRSDRPWPHIPSSAQDTILIMPRAALGAKSVKWRTCSTPHINWTDDNEGLQVACGEESLEHANHDYVRYR